MGDRTGDRVDVCRAVCRAARRDDCTAIDRMGGYKDDYRTFLVY
jgi:cob(I)alamin adenosyltransferase